MKKALLLKPMLLLCALIVGMSSAWGQTTSTLTFTAACGGSGTADDGAEWTVTSDAAESTFDSTRGVHYGTGSKSVSYIQLETSDITTGTITKVVVNASGSNSPSLSVKVDGNAFGNTITGITNSNAAYTFEGSAAAGTIVVRLAKAGKYNGALYVKSVAVTYTTGGGGEQTVNVTGVTLDPTSLTMEIGDTETLIATVAPSNATNKSVTWSSSNGNVATVSNGVVTAVGVGNATITVTTVDGNKTATCAVTVSDGSSPVVTNEASVIFNFKDDADKWGFPGEYTTTEESYTYNGYTFTLGESSKGHKKVIVSNAVQSLLFGKEDATLVFPAFPFNVSKIVIYGYSGASTKTTFNIFVGDTPLFTDDFIKCTITHEIEIPEAYQAKGTVYTYKVTNDNNAQVSKIEVFGYETVSVSAAGMATYASDYALDYSDVTGGLAAYTAKVNGSTVTLTDADEVPAAEGVLLKAEEGTYKVPVIPTAAAIDNDFIRGNDVPVPSEEGGYKNYILSTNSSNVVGFYLAAGKTVAKNRAYLSAPVTSAPELSMEWGDETTGIQNIERIINDNQYYTLDGRRVAEPTKGLYIINGKKVVIK